MNLKIAFISPIIFSILTFAVPINSFADSIPQAFIDDIRAHQVMPDKTLDSGFGIFIRSQNPKLQINTVNEIAEYVAKYSNENNIDPKLVLALMARESSFRSNAVSKSGAIGLGQLKRKTALEMGVTNPFNIIENIKGTVKYLSWLLKHNDGNLDLTLASYNMGPGAVKRAIIAGIILPGKVEKYVSDIKSFHSMI